MKTVITALLLLVTASLAVASPFIVAKTHATPTSDTREMRMAGTGEIIHVSTQPILTADDVLDARLVEQNGSTFVAVVLSREGRIKFEKASEESIGSRLAIVVADELLSAPRVMQKISTESIQVTGLSEAKAKELVEVLKKK
jgi:preprotein translocase subunit SecD